MPSGNVLRLTYRFRPAASLKNSTDSIEVRRCGGCDGISGGLSCFRALPAGSALPQGVLRGDNVDCDHLTDRSTDLTNDRPGSRPAAAPSRPHRCEFSGTPGRPVIYDRRAGSATISRSRALDLRF